MGHDNPLIFSRGLNLDRTVIDLAMDILPIARHMLPSVEFAD